MRFSSKHFRRSLAYFVLTGKSRTRRILFKDKSPDYEVDETTGRVFNLRNPKELTVFVVQ